MMNKRFFFSAWALVEEKVENKNQKKQKNIRKNTCCFGRKQKIKNKKYKENYMVPLNCLRRVPTLPLVGGMGIRAGFHVKNASIISVYHLMRCVPCFL